MNFIQGLLLLAATASALDFPDIVIVILSQENGYHKSLAENLKNDILIQAESLSIKPVIHVLPEKSSHVGYWTLIPELPRLVSFHGSNSSWIYFCEDRTVINLENLLNLNYLNLPEKSWVGFGLNDEEPSIIHHFAFAENPSIFKYPLMSAGFAVTTSLLKKIVAMKLGLKEQDSEFSIDASHELALYVGLEYPLIHRPDLFCDKPESSCISYPAKIKLCDPPVNINEIFFAVKTCQKYHQNRIPIVQKTWGQFAKHIEFYSDVGNKSIPTKQVGVKNTERGHCLKTMRILELALNEVMKSQYNIKWVVLADDDTILSVERLQSLLACYSPDTVVGERYGYKVYQGKGYNYLTGGGGIAFGVETLHDIISLCHCPQIDSPDDMVLGMCMTSIKVPFVHSPLFHQARPMDYARSYLSIGSPVSFHKHWNIDPLLIYKKWFLPPSYEAIHTEL